jgi:hypothetical protein
MSFLSWFSSRKQEPQHSVMPTSGLSRLESTKAFNAARQPAAAQPANRKHERLARRELLYAVVREAMVRAGVLSSNYKFKVLSLDPRGRQFMVMVDLAQGSSSDTSRLAEIEAMIAQSAKARCDIQITAVYWRTNEHVAVGDPAHRTSQRSLVSQPAPLASRPAPLSSRPAPLNSRPAPLSSQPAPLMGDESRPAELHAAPVSRAERFEPLHADEVAAFHKALAAGVRGEAALAATAATAAAKAAQNYTLLTGFEDTAVDGSDAVGEHLSGTQYGALR